MSRSLGVLTLDLIAKTSSFEQGMDRASRRTRSTTSEFEKAAAAAQKLALAAGAAATAFAASSAAIVMNAAKAMDATSKMAQQIGVTTEALTGMRFAAQQFSSISDQQFDQAMRRMTRRIEEAAAGSGAAKKALEEMGLSARALSQMTPDRQMLALADAMKRTESQANRLRYTMAIFDTEGMALVPALQQGAAAFEENIKLAERYGVVLSTEAAQAAEQFNTNLSHLTSMLDGLKMQLASEVLPTINQFITNVIQASTEVDGLHSEVKNLSENSTFKAWFDATLVGLARVADVAVFLAKAVGVVGGAFRSVAADAEVAVAAINKAQAWNWFSDEATNELQSALARRNQIVGGFNKDLEDLFTYQGNKFEQAALSAINTIRITSDGVKLVDLTTQGATKTLEANSAATKKNAAALTEAQRAAQAFRREQDQGLRAQLQAVSAIHQQAGALEDQVLLFGQSKTAIEDLTIARLEEQAVLLSGFTGSQEQVEAIEREIEARQRLRTAIGSLEQKEAEKQAWEDWSRDVEQIFDRVGQSLTDAIFDGGKSGRDLLRDMFKSLTFNVLINPIMNQMQGWVTNQLGGMFGAQNPQQQGGGILGMAQNANTAYQAYSGGMASNMGNMITGLGNRIGSQALQSFGLGMSGTTAATGIAALGSGLGASLGATIGTSAATMASTSFAASMAGGALVPGLGVGAAGAGVGAGIGAAAGSAGAATAGGLAGIGSAVGAALPWVGGALAIGSALGVFGDREPTTRREQRTQVEYAGGLFDVTKRDDRAPAGADAAARALAETAVQTANDIFKQVGVDAAIDSFHAIMASSYAGDRDGVASGGTLRIGDELRRIGIANEGNPTVQGFGGWSSAETLPRLATDIQLTVLEAFQQADILSSILADIDIRGLGDAAAAELSATVQMIVQEVSAFQTAVEGLPFAQLRDLSFDAAANLIQFAGGLENLDAGLTAYHQHFYSESEQIGFATEQMTDALGALGFVMPDMSAGADDARFALRSFVESLDVTQEEGARAFATVMGLAGSYSELADAASAATDRVLEDARRRGEAFLQERERLDDRLFSMTASVTEMRERELNALSKANRSIQMQIWALEDLARASEAATQVSAGFAGVRENILLDQLGGPDAQYDYFKQQADGLARLIPTLTDIDAITRASSQIQSITSRAYGLLDEGQRQEMGGEFLEYLNRTEDTVLRQIQEANKQQSEDNAKIIADAVADEMKRVGNAIVSALQESGKDNVEGMRAVVGSIGRQLQTAGGAIAPSQYKEVNV